MFAFLLPIVSSVGAALRVPALAIFLGQLGANILGWFAARMTRGLAMNLTILTMIIGVAALSALAIKSLITGLSYVVPPYLSLGFSFFVPSNAIPCLSAIFAARVIRWVWVWQFYAINKVAG
ncbi:MAG: DUF5455 family protein [Vibrionaceae bacterium]|nr:DUF5455 family protein [Vibrionaceae bacterium]